MNTESSDRDCPYRGLEPFDERDAPYFFGRERETRLITASLFAAPLTLLYGASGVGKSSVLRAGVLPSLRRRPDVLPVVFPTIEMEQGSTVIRGWQSDPLGGIKETVSAALFRTAKDDGTRRKLRDAVLMNEMAPLGEFLRACNQASELRVMLILDQFEEYSLYHPEDDAFGIQLPQAIVAGDLSVSFLVSLREDSVAKLDRFKGRIPTLWDSYRRIDHLDRKSAEDAIRKPLAEYHRQNPETPEMQVEEELVNSVLMEVEAENVQFETTGSGTVASQNAGRIETPYLQLVLTRLWERERQENSATLRLSTLRDEGGAAQIVRTHLDRVMSQFSEADRDVAARVFHRLVTPSGAKIAFSVRDLAEYEGIDSRQLAPILQQLEAGTRRILRRVASKLDAADEPRYEIFHDRLGKAVLEWRSKRLQEQQRERHQHQAAEQKRIGEETLRRYQDLVSGIVQEFPERAKLPLSRLTVFLIMGGHTARELAERTEVDPDSVHEVLHVLVSAGIVHRSGDVDPVYKIIDPEMARVLATNVWGRTAEVQAEAQTEPQEVPHREFPYRMIRDRLVRGEVIPFLGGGVSLSATGPHTGGLPTGPQIKESMARMCDFPMGDFDRSDIAEIASFFVQRLGRPALDSFLSERLSASDLSPSPTHKLLAEAARWTPLLILTTNYDTLMERALDKAGVDYDAIAPVGLEGVIAVVRGGAVSYIPVTRLDVQERPVVFRLHGPSITPTGTTGSYAIAEEDQIDWIVRMQTILPTFVLRKMNRSPLLWLGSSARDWAQRAFLRALYDKRERTGNSWAVTLNPAPVSVLTWQRYDVEVFNLDLNEWAQRMREAV